MLFYAIIIKSSANLLKKTFCPNLYKTLYLILSENTIKHMLKF